MLVWKIPKRKSSKFFFRYETAIRIAIALLGEPEFLMLDEPTNGLDPVNIIEMRELLKNLAIEKQLTILVSSHILGELYQLATNYIFLHQGKVVQEITKEQLDNRCKKHISILVNDVSKAVVILERTLNTNNYTILPDQSIQLYDYVDDMQKVITALSENQLIIKNIGIAGDSLENYFINTIGVIKMYNLIKTELYKLKRQKLFIILFLIVIAISSFSTFSEINLVTPTNPVTGKESFANAFQDIFMLFVIAIFAGFYIGSDFSNRTIQTELSRGHKRTDIIFAKAFVYSLGASVLMLLYPITVCIIHTINFGWGEAFSISSILYFLRVTLLGSILNIGTACIYVCFAFCVEISLKQYACVLPFLYCFQQLVAQLENIFPHLVQY